VLKAIRSFMMNDMKEQCLRFELEDTASETNEILQTSIDDNALGQETYR
jgi:hypothetical protein